MPTKTLSPEILSAALLGLEAQRQRLESQIADVRRLIGAGAVLPAAKEPKSSRTRRKMSAAARKRIREAQKKRWAAYHKAQEAPSPAKSAMVTKAPEKRRLSAAGRKAIVAAARKRWAAVRQQKAATVATTSAASKKPAKKAARKATVQAPAAVVKRAE
jgi:hypothetical protein